MRIYLLKFLILFPFWVFAQPIKVSSFSVSIVEKTLLNGKATTVNSEVLFKSDGRLVTHVLTPVEMYVLNDRFGNVTNYNPKLNTVNKMTDPMYSTLNSQYYYYVTGQYNDMGLKSLGFELFETQTKDGVVVQWFKAPATMHQVLLKARLALRQGKPIYIGFYNNQNREIKRMYFKDIEKISGLSFPKTVIQIDKTSPSDSIITKTVYSNFKINKEIDQKLANFLIPTDAKVIQR